jgi:hypothetical protein
LELLCLCLWCMHVRPSGDRLGGQAFMGHYTVNIVHWDRIAQGACRDIV